MIAKAPIAPVWSWSGFYAGGHGGYGWGRDSTAIKVDPGFLLIPERPQTVLSPQFPKRKDFDAAILMT